MNSRLQSVSKVSRIYTPKKSWQSLGRKVHHFSNTDYSCIKVVNIVILEFDSRVKEEL